MDQTVSLDPAAKIIDAFGGRKRVHEITGRSQTRVYRWTQPATNGGTDGVIPMSAASKLLAHARENGIPVSADDFIPAPSREAAE